MFIHIILFLFEENKYFHKYKNKLFLKNYISILKKLYKEKIIDKKILLIIIEFISLLSIYERNDFIVCEIPKNKVMKNYFIFKYSLDIIKQINDVDIALEYLDFINKNIIKYKANLFLITEKT